MELNNSDNILPSDKSQLFWQKLFFFRIPQEFLYNFNQRNTQQGRHGQFLAGKADTVEATSAACCCCRRFCFCKIQARSRPWGSCQPWRPCPMINAIIKLSLLHRSTSLCEEKCKDDHECGNKEICLHEECQKGCRNDNHCITGTKCYENICITSCKMNKDCQPSQYCHIDHKVCFAKCTSNQDCAVDYKCDNGQCFQSCEASECLATGQYCHE